MKNQENFRIVFMGTPDFAVASLRALVENNYQVVGVVSVPDKPAGRGQKLQQSAVKMYAEAQGLPVLQPEKLRDPQFIEALRSWQADLQIVVAFRMLPEIVWSMPPFGTFNLHGSLLPQYRGAAPLNWAIINGERESGVTTFMLQQQIDTGHIIDQVKHPIGADDNVGDLHDALMDIGAQLVIKTVQVILSGNLTTIPQESITHAPLKDAPKLFKQDCRISWDQDLQNIHNFVRGLAPYPSAWTQLIAPNKTEKVLKISRLAPEKATHHLLTGTLITDGKTHLKVAVPDGFASLLLLQLEGKRRMCIEEFLHGFTFQEGMKLR